MKHYLFVVLLVVISSFYYFPCTFNALPGINTKMMVAFAGLVFFVWERSAHKIHTMRMDMVGVLVLGLLFSLAAYFSVVYNDTNERVFTTYFVSMSVWLGGAYCIVHLLRKFYGIASLQMVFLLMALVCAGQCILAILIDNVPSFANVVNSIFQVDVEIMEKRSRLYGIGAAYDTAGIRYSAALLGIGYLLRHETLQKRRLFYLGLLLVIVIIGNMMSRTTLVGMAVTGVYLLFSSSWLQDRITSRGFFWFMGICVGLVALFMVGEYMYDHIPVFHNYMRYGFEAFFNYFEKGTFSTHSSDLLINGITILPDNLKTWLVGDGYFVDPYNPSLFYMGTDMGYARFIFFCGLLGFSCFLTYFIYCTRVLCLRDESRKLVFVMLFVLQLIVWIKIPTDLFCMYALLLLCDGHRPVESENLSGSDCPGSKILN